LKLIYNIFKLVVSSLIFRYLDKTKLLMTPAGRTMPPAGVRNIKKENLETIESILKLANNKKGLSLKKGARKAYVSQAHRG
jgi:hypothetical protein